MLHLDTRVVLNVFNINRTSQSLKLNINVLFYCFFNISEL